MTASPPSAPPPPPSLAMALIVSSAAPLLLLDGDLVVVAASASFCSAFAIGAAAVTGRPLAALGAGEWDVPQLLSLLSATASGIAEVPAYEMILHVTGAEDRRLVISARRLLYDAADEVRLLVAISDVTEAWRDAARKDDLLREKAVLLQELQHRVANSLQIIASVLMQNARMVQSEESRGHLTDAHSRVMSVAAVQRQLAASTLGEVALGPYLTQLCRSLGASMIHDAKLLRIDVDAEDVMVEAGASLSLGLVVTELVINALKHAFPDGRSGSIRVGYRTEGEGKGAGWRLSVKDDGVGMPTGAARAQPGLGTGIVEALARQLGSAVVIDEIGPGVEVSLTRPATA